MKKTFKEFITTAKCAVSPMSLINHNGILYKLDRIFELSIDLPVTNMPLDGLRWMRDAYPGSPDDIDKENKADLSVPIIVTPQNGEYIIIDGMHRVAKALKNGETTIKTRIIFHDILVQSKLGGQYQSDLNPYLASDDRLEPGYGTANVDWVSLRKLASQ